MYKIITFILKTSIIILLLNNNVVAKNGAEIYIAKGCIACHGANGQSPIIPSYPKLTPKNKNYLIKEMVNMKNGTRNTGQSVVMTAIMRSVSENDIKALAEYISNGFYSNKKLVNKKIKNNKYITSRARTNPPHTHGKFKHEHPLPLIGVKHKHRGPNQSIGKVVPVSKQKSKLAKNWIYDQNNCIHYNPNPIPNETLTWSGACKEGYADGYGKRVWLQGGKANQYRNVTLIKGKRKALTKEQILANKKATRESERRAIATLSTIFGFIAKGVGAVVDSAKEASNSSSYTPPTRPFCNTDTDTCFEITREISKYKFEIRCTKGSNTGLTSNICQNGKGNWAYACGAMTIGSFHDKSSRIAGNKACR